MVRGAPGVHVMTKRHDIVSHVPRARDCRMAHPKRPTARLSTKELPMTFDYQAAGAALVFWVGLAAWVGAVCGVLITLLTLL